MTPQQITEAQRLADALTGVEGAYRTTPILEAAGLLRTLAAQAAQDQRPAAWRVQVDGLWFHARETATA